MFGEQRKVIMTKVFIDGSAGTTGLRINERLAGRSDIELIALSEELRKNEEARKEALYSADIAFLCLPDDAAKEAAALSEGSKVKLIDTSTAHRVNDSWVYGFPELKGQRDKIKESSRIANPGCHASGFISLAAPLVQLGVLDSGASLSCFSLTGYSGGGKKMIANYEADERDALLDSPGLYGVGQQHKHLPEMAKISGLKNPPAFCPVVAPYYSGMLVTVPLTGDDISAGIEEIERIYSEYYSGENSLVSFKKYSGESTLYAGSLSGSDCMEITVTGNADRILLISRFDNLGKGASGSAIQNMNILMGVDDKVGLVCRRDG